MKTFFQISSTQYDDDKILIIKALSHICKLFVKIKDGYAVR